MKNDIEQIRDLLDSIENSSRSAHEDSIRETFDLFELPQIIKDIVDYLLPLVSPYESDIYWNMFRHSIIETGDVYVRTSNAKLARGIGTKFKRGKSKIGVLAKLLSQKISDL